MSPGSVGSKQWIVGAWGRGLEALLNGESDKWLGEGILCIFVVFYHMCKYMYIVCNHIKIHIYI